MERYKNATEGESYYLGEFASLKVTTKSETANADEITKHIVPNVSCMIFAACCGKYCFR